MTIHVLDREPLGYNSEFITTEYEVVWEGLFQLQQEWARMIRPRSGRAFSWRKAGIVLMLLQVDYRWDDERDNRSMAELSEPVFFVEVARSWERNVLRWLVDEAQVLVELSDGKRTGKRILMWNMATIGAAFNRKRVRQMTELLDERRA